ncbi:hypothetical protein HMPREF0063_10553 [Aeromicrobium marinum DSM 15272]|uniref:Uncharacterized protein n=1 Tax=Aeromicrobium marinum DSM 15272 TaxID=585531 RepID=E2S9B3_9ACTN|nr:hypothetical protein [Aeromicrobium marinum]EFQ83837.1 hypothetical protein HMPREF0063_10553 [Aeromicrobium marinum DSM 15272]
MNEPRDETFAETRYDTPQVIRSFDLAAKAVLIVLLAMAISSPDLGNMEDKGAGARAVGYPLISFTIPALWYVFWRDRASFPWMADLLITVTCFTDILGNRLDLYDRVVWFDDWMHFMNTGLLAAAVILLTMHHTSTRVAVVERGLAFGVTAALVWEVAEYYAFLSVSPERMSAYGDTLADLVLGGLGSLTAAVVIHLAWQRGRLVSAAPQLELRFSPTR